MIAVRKEPEMSPCPLYKTSARLAAPQVSTYLLNAIVNRQKQVSLSGPASKPLRLVQFATCPVSGAVW